MEKICSKCKEKKYLTDFSKNKNYKDGYKGSCKICTKEYKSLYYKKNIESYKDAHKNYRLNNVDKVKAATKKYYLNNSEKITEYKKEYFQKNKEQISIIAKKYNLENREVLNKKYRDRKENNPIIKLKCNTRSLIGASIRRQGYSKDTKTHQILGCSFDEFKNYLEARFTEGMNWCNYGKWHLDHIYPVSLAKDKEEIITLNHYTNFQPLWAIDNLKKGNKI
tara:strand:- start:72 stop:737 length:666 start_codon:yes stop_codon:yes gene_type:complete